MSREQCLPQEGATDRECRWAPTCLRLFPCNAIEEVPPCC